MWGEFFATGFAAICLARWSQKADSESAGANGNGFLQTAFGRGVLKFAAPGRYRILFPFLLFPERSASGFEEPDWTRWGLYQCLRLACLWSALALLSLAFGMLTMFLAAALYGLTLRFDYWSNAVEFLGVSVVLASGVLGWPLLAYLGAGIVCGLGRETTALLALLGTPAAACFGVGAAISHGAVRLISRPDQQWLEAEDNMSYGQPMWRTNLHFFWSDPASMADLAIYMSIAALACFTAPWLTLALVLVTFLVARIDEPRVLTMLIPAAAIQVTKIWL